MQGFVPMSGKRQSWEELRKEARGIENQIDSKLVQLSKLGTDIGSSSTSNISPPSNSDKAPLLNGNSDDDVESSMGSKEDRSSPSYRFKILSDETGKLLQRLSDINDGLNEWANNGGGGASSVAGQHTLQRHRDILQDYRQEFNKTRSNVASIIERHDLLDSVHKDISDYQRNMQGNQGSTSNRRMELLLKENEHARRSERMIDDQINIAVESRETLMNQRVAFKAIQTKLNDISNRFPLINNLVQKINMRKRRDTIIMGSVIGLCLVFLLWYWLG